MRTSTSVRSHLIRALLFSLGAALVGILGLHLAQTRETAAFTANYTQERTEQLKDALSEQSDLLGLFALDYAGWDEMVAFTQSLDPEWARINIAEVMQRFHLDVVWLLSPDGRLLHASFSDTADLPAAPPPGIIAAIIAEKDWSQQAGGFFQVGDRIFDLRARPVQPSDDLKRITPPVGWLLGVRACDERLLTDLGRRLKATVHFHIPPPLRPDPPPPGGSIVVTARLPAYPSGPDIAEVHAEFDAESLRLGEHYNELEFLVLVLCALFMLGGVTWSARRHVLLPIEHITASLETDSPAPLERVDPDLREFVRIAEQLKRSFAQSDALRHEIEERIRLGRDLHDGVIQNLYAAGLGLAHAGRLLSTDPAQAAARMEDIRRTLNESMATLRGYIARSEPETSGDIDLAAGFHTLFQTLAIQTDARLELDVDPASRTDLPRAVKADLLFIVREAASNALRHGHARNVSIFLRREGLDWVLRVRDDGKGFDPARFHPARATDSGGRGLGNLHVRANELEGRAHIESSPGQGCEVRVSWPAEG